VKVARLEGARLAIALALAVAACNGDDSAAPTGGSAGAAGAVDGAAGGDSSGGSGGQGGGSVGGGGGTATDAAPDTSGDVSSGSGGSIATDANDGATPTQEANADGGEAAADASIVCPSADAGDGPVRLQLYSFEGASAGADLAAWSTFSMGPIVASVDDSTPESNTPGSLHATITYTAFNTSPVLESYHAVPLDFSCFTTFHVSIKITSSVAYVPFIVLYVTSGAVAPGVGYFSGNLLPGIADGNWHELTATLSGNKAAIQRIGFQVYPATTMPDGGPAIPPPVDIFLDNIWLE
jgi:hypothetical protein